MTKQTTYLLGILITILLGAWLYSKYCCHCPPIKAGQEKIISNSEVVNSEKELDNSFKIKGETFSFSCEKNFNFQSDSLQYVKPIANCIDEGILKLKTFLNKNPNGKIKITGYCLSSEKNTTAFPNLGFARANEIKNYMITKGIPSSKFDIEGITKEYWQHKNDTITGPVSYTLTNDILLAKGEDWLALKEKINQNPLVLYFNTNETQLDLTLEERNKITDLVRYLDHVPEARIRCVGHTDNVGERKVNIYLGQTRAKFAKTYLISNGITKERIITDSKGPDEPIADNVTLEGKARNRRTVITIQ